MKKNTGEQRREIIADIVMQHVTGIETLGTAIRRLRLEVTGLDQETFAVMCKIISTAHLSTSSRVLSAGCECR